MIRLAEIGLFALPLAAYLLWHILLRRGLPGPSRELLLVLLAGLLLMGVSLVWTSLAERHADTSRYVPARMQNGRLVPGHEA